MSDSDLNTAVLDRLIKAMGTSHYIRVGILGSTSSRSGENSNATIGAVHEFGTSSVPRRSFLVDPMKDQLASYIEASGAFKEDVLKEVIATSSFVPWMKKIAIIAETVVIDAFRTAGFGKWVAWRNPNYQNNTGQLLVDTQQLRNSITTDVK